MSSTTYCISRFETVRRRTREVKVGPVGIGGDNPIRVQSMTTTPTQDVEATVRQSIALAEAGCEIVRITAQNLKAAQALGDIRKRLNADGFGAIPLVADIHFLPQTAMEAALHVEKVRINPGNYADKKKFQVLEYTDAEYRREVERLYEAFTPIVLRCKELGRAMRIGTNHGSLSDRIMNRYGDTPAGMCESALEFLRIAESHGYHDIVISMKASNPKVMIEAYRLMVAQMAAEDMHYPLHLGVTEAGDGDDARIKSAIGIGALLYDGLGDTIRVSLTEDPVYEIPVARALADKATRLWRDRAARTTPDPVDPYAYRRREVISINPGNRGTCPVSPMDPPRVIQPMPGALARPEAAAALLASAQKRLGEARIEGLLVRAANTAEATAIPQLRAALAANAAQVAFFVWDLDPTLDPTSLDWSGAHGDLLLCSLAPESRAHLPARLALARDRGLIPVLEATAEDLHACADTLRAAVLAEHGAVATLRVENGAAAPAAHALGRYRALAEALAQIGLAAPIWIRNTATTAIAPREYFSDQLLEASMLTGPLICDGIGDLVSVETVPDLQQSTRLAYNLLQGSRARSTKTEFVACPSCGRTLFDLQSTTQRIRAATGHLKGVTIAVMGCIVNGPGEMADADFGYVGGAPGRINLYVGKQCVQYNIPTDKAVDALIELIRSHGKWVDPEPVAEA